MNREEYLKRLSFLLKDLPEEERLNQAIQEYKDIFLATKGNTSSTEDKLKSIQNA